MKMKRKNQNSSNRKVFVMENGLKENLSDQ